MGVQRSEEFFESSQNSIPNLYKDLVTLQIFTKGKTHTIVSGKRNGTYVGFLLNKNFTSQAINNVLMHLNNPHKGFSVKEFSIKVSDKNNKILEALKATNDEVMNILLENNLLQSSNNSEEFPETSKGLEYQTSHKLYEYTANNRKKFYVVFDTTGNIVEVVAKNGPMSFVTQMQKNHIKQKWENNEAHRFEKIEKSPKTNALISQIEEKMRVKKLGIITHPEINGEYIYTNSHQEDLVVQVQNGKVISVLPTEVSPQQRGAIQKKLNLLGEEAFHAKVQAISLQDLVEGDEEKLLCPYKNEFNELYELSQKYETYLISDQYSLEDKHILIQDIFDLIEQNFSEYKMVREPKRDFHKSFVRFQVFLKHTGQRYPFLKSESGVLSKIMNIIKTLLS